MCRYDVPARSLLSRLTNFESLQIALSAIRRIGRRAHPLISVNYFAWAVVISTTILGLAQRLTWPASSKDWGLLVVVGILGTIMVSCYLHLSGSLR